jgi:hypothetical protein
MALTLNGSTGLSGIVGSAGTPALQGTDTNTGYFFGTDILGLSTGGSERLRITSGGEIRIGGNEGGYKLNVIDQSNRTTTAETGLLLYAKHDGSGTTGAGFGTGIRFWGDRASGNIEQNMGRIMCIADVNSGTTLSSAFTFETGVAGVLGEKLRITSAGDVGIGVSLSSGIKLHIKDTTSDGAIKLEGTGSTLGTWITLQNNDATANSYSMIQGADAGGQGTSEIKFINVNNSNNEGTLTVGTRPSGGSMQERLRIDSDGRVLIGQTSSSSSSKLCVYGAVSTEEAFFELNRTDDPANNQNIGVIEFSQGSAASRLAARIMTRRDGGVWGASSLPTRFEFHTCVSGSNTAAERVRISSNGNLNILDGDLQIGTAGHGIDFSAQTASSATDVTVNGELLDHFEEGTWTPVQPTVGWYSGAEIEGKYQRVGHWVTATFIVKFPDNGSGIQGLIDGLPFVSGGSGSAGRHGGAPSYTTDSNVQSFLVGNGQARIYIYNGSGASVQCSNLDDDEIRGTVIYRVA